MFCNILLTHISILTGSLLVCDIINLILCFVDRASLYNLVNKANFVHNLFLIYLSISTCFMHLCAHHQEKKLYLRDTGMQGQCRKNSVVSPDDGHIVAQNT